MKLSRLHNPRDNKLFNFPLTFAHVIGYPLLHTRTPDLMAGIPGEAPENEFW